jgi:eukaryotic-like serine/threonine-protein kinase
MPSLTSVSMKRSSVLSMLPVTVATCGINGIEVFRPASRAVRQPDSMGCALSLTALSTSKGRDVQYAAILALAFIGDANQARQLSEQLSKDFPYDTLVQAVYRPTVNAQIAIDRRDSSGAVEALKVVSPYELGIPGDSEFLLSLYPVYVRGNAYLAAGQGAEAAAEFARILSWPGVVLNEPIAPLAYLGLARAYAQQGDADKAKAAYENFFNTWKDADPNVPILEQARYEYMKT